jgi:hypothetical protein
MLIAERTVLYCTVMSLSVLSLVPLPQGSVYCTVQQGSELHLTVLLYTVSTGCATWGAEALWGPAKVFA